MSDVYDEIKRHFAEVDDATVNVGRGAQGIKYEGKLFAMFHKGQLLVQFAPERVQELIARGEAHPHDPGTGTPMKDRVLVPDSKADAWVALAEESLDYVRSR